MTIRCSRPHGLGGRAGSPPLECVPRPPRSHPGKIREPFLPYAHCIALYLPGIISLLVRRLPTLLLVLELPDYHGIQNGFFHPISRSNFCLETPGQRTVPETNCHPALGLPSSGVGVHLLSVEVRRALQVPRICDPALSRRLDAAAYRNCEQPKLLTAPPRPGTLFFSSPPSTVTKFWSRSFHHLFPQAV